MKRWLGILLKAAQGWLGDNAFKHAGAVSFYTLFSVAPLTIIAISVAGFIFGEDAARGELSAQIAGLVGEESAEVVESLVAASRPQESGWLPTAFGAVMLLVGASTVFGQLQESLNEIWGVVARPTRNSIVVLVIRRLMSFALVLTIGFLLLVSLMLTTVVTIVINYAQSIVPLHPVLLRAMDLGLALTVITVLFAMIFKVLPDVQLRWHDVWKGAFLTALLFSVGRFLISIYLGRTGVASTYGAAGSLVVLLMWVYYSTLILFFGVEFTRAYLEECGVKVRPKSTAVRVHRQIVADAES
jgi:membrane protein